ncbi:hypothetical protein OAG63_01205 [Methylacidiphilales bacterium]|nr:hypothetical protein [Candidatus Methylacidiphilales bacterium]
MMTAWCRGVTLLFALCFFSPHLRADDSDAALNADVQRIIAAVKNNDLGLVVDMMYSPYVEAAGGVDSVKAQAAAAKTVMNAKGLKILSFDCIKPFTPISTADRDYVIIPVHTVMEMDSHQYDITSYWLAIKAHGTAKWQYLSGSGLNKMPEVKKRLLPDLKDTPLPEIKTKMLN